VVGSVNIFSFNEEQNTISQKADFNHVAYLIIPVILDETLEIIIQFT
jgi:hypothetical protein